MTTNYIDHKISTRISRDFKRVVSGKTDIVTLNSGRERRNAAWAYKKLKFTATYNQLDYDSQQEIVSAFYACQAQLYLFRFRDWGDYVVQASPLNTSSLVGTKTAVQLTKRYTFGPTYADRMVQAISTCVVNGPSGAVFAGTFDSALGLFTPTAAWASGTYTWTGTFDLWVRFNSDDLDITMSNIDMATSDIELIEQIAYSSGS